MSIQITTLRYTRRFNVAQYEHEEITVDAVPAEGQTAEDLLAATRKFVESSRPKVNGAYIVGVETNAPATSAVEATKKKGGRPKKTENPTTAAQAASPSQGTSSSQSADSFEGLVKELEGLGTIDIPALDEACNQIAARFRAINSPAANDPAKKRVVELLVEYKKQIDEATPEN